jgi:hypothetical protein
LLLIFTNFCLVSRLIPPELRQNFRSKYNTTLSSQGEDYFFLCLNPPKKLVAGKKPIEKGGQLSDPLGFKDSAEIS